MSIKAMTKVFEADLVDQDFRALIAMADHADDEGGSIFPSVEWLAWKIGKSERQTQRIIRRLRDVGYLELVRPARRMRPNEYKLVFATLPPKTPFKRGLNDIPAGMRESVIAEGDQVCALCEQRGDATHGPDGQVWNVDRIVPAADGGRYEWGNVRLTCGTCNRRERFKPRGATDGTPENTDDGTPGVPPKRHPSGAIQTAPEPSVEPSVNQTASIEAVRESDPEAVRLCGLLATLMRENDPKAKLPAKDTPGRDAWVRDMRLLIKDRDGDAAEVESVIRWSQADDFEKANIRSPGKLRKRFSELLLKTRRASQPTGRIQRTTTDSPYHEVNRLRGQASQFRIVDPEKHRRLMGEADELLAQIKAREAA